MISNDKTNFLVRADTHSLAVASIQMKGPLVDGTVIAFQVVGFSHHEEFCVKLSKKCLRCANQVNYIGRRNDSNAV